MMEEVRKEGRNHHLEISAIFWCSVLLAEKKKGKKGENYVKGVLEKAPP
jgi:hypothetical protein